MNKWFDSINSKRSTVIIEKSKYKQLIKDIRPVFLETFEGHTQIINNFNQLNILSINKSIELFFEEINFLSFITSNVSLLFKRTLPFLFVIL